ncbi:MAG: hypothetical protein MZU79_04435 [Anaerotruncus sp.]|nr:hypothetical protein [Anaerotruncus sp.]
MRPEDRKRDPDGPAAVLRPQGRAPVPHRRRRWSGWPGRQARSRSAGSPWPTRARLLGLSGSRGPGRDRDGGTGS